MGTLFSGKYCFLYKGTLFVRAVKYAKNVDNNDIFVNKVNNAQNFGFNP